MKKRIASSLTALALCLSLLPGTAWAATPMLRLCGTDIETNCYYTIKADGSGVEKVSKVPANQPYLEYAIASGMGTLTAHGSVALTYDGGEGGEGEVLYSGVNLDITGDDITLTATGQNDVIDGVSGYPLSLKANNVTLTATGGGHAIGINMRTTITASGKVAIASKDGEAVKGPLTIADSSSVEITDESGKDAFYKTTSIKSSGDVVISSAGAIIDRKEETLNIESGGNVVLRGGKEETEVDPATAAFPYPSKLTVKAAGNITIDDKYPMEDYIEEQLTASGTLTLPSVKNVTLNVGEEDGITSVMMGEGEYQIYTDGSDPAVSGNLAYTNLTITGTAENMSILVANIPASCHITLKDLHIDSSSTPTSFSPLMVTATGKIEIGIEGDVELIGSTCAVRSSSQAALRGSGNFTAVVRGEATSSGPFPISTISSRGTSGFSIDVAGDVSIRMENDDENTALFDNSVSDGGTTYPISITGKNVTLAQAGKAPTYENDVASGGVTISATEKLSNMGVITQALDFSDEDTAPGTLETDGYHWDARQKTLTLNNIVLSGKVTLPDDTVTIVTQEESSIGTLTPPESNGSANPQKTNLTFSGPGKLTIQEPLNISGGHNLGLTVDAGAQVEALGGITICADGGVDGAVTINGTLTAKGDAEGPALSSGKVVVGSGGTLNVSGEKGGVAANGTSDNIYTGAFTLMENGTLNANCKEFVIAVHSGKQDGFNPSVQPNEVISIPAGYLPQGHDPHLTDNGQSVVIVADGPFTIGKKNVPSTPSGGGGSSTSTYAITVEESTHGSVTADRTRASAGSTITLTVAPDSGYALDSLTATDSRGKAVELTNLGDGKYRFTMPSAAVTVGATFAEETRKPCDGGTDCPSRPFSDLDTSQWYHEAVDYVLSNGWMNGYGNRQFGPEDPLSRAQFAQILHNKAGRPVVNYLLWYEDVAADAWYTEAIRWATSQRIVDGYGDGRFGPDDSITREQLAAMLWRYAGRPATSGSLSFADADQASDWALEALAWATQVGVLNGKSGGILDPGGTATRAETAQMLRNFMSQDR